MNYLKSIWFTLGLLYFISGCVYTYKEIKFIKWQKDLLLISYARLMYCFTFGFIPASLCFMYSTLDIEVKLKTLVVVDYSYDGLVALFFFWMFSVIGYTMLNIGYKNIYVLKYGNTKLLSKNNHKITEMQSFTIAAICLIIGGISLYLWTLNEGNVFNFIIKANWYRGDSTNAMNNPYAMLRVPSRILELATFLFFFYLINNNTKHKLLYFIGYFWGLALSILYLLCIDGRLEIALFFGMQVIGLVLYRHKKVNITKRKIYEVSTIAFFALFLISQLDNITYYIRYGAENGINTNPSESFYIMLMNEFAYIYETGQMAIQTNIFDFGKWMLIDDIVRGFFSCFPSKFTPDGFERVWRWNTYLCTGSRLSATIPCDIISESIYDLSVFGPFIIPFLFGTMVRQVEVYFSDVKSRPFYRACYIFLALAFFRIINYCELYDFMRGMFSFCVMWIVYLFVVRLSLKNRMKG